MFWALLSHKIICPGSHDDILLEKQEVDASKEEMPNPSAVTKKTVTPSPESFSEAAQIPHLALQELFRYPLPQEVLKGLTRQLFFFFSFGENEGGLEW